jgi:UPF0755 protein
LWVITLGSRLRGNDNHSAFSVIPAKAGTRFTYSEYGFSEPIGKLWSTVLNGSFGLKNIYALLLVAVLTCFIVAVSIFLDLLKYADAPASQHDNQVIFSVHSGENFNQMSRRLFDQRIIRQPLKFSWYARLKGLDKKIKAGEYVLSASLTPKQILSAMIRGKVALYKVTIPEGYNLYQIAVLLSQNKIMTEKVFIQKATDVSFVTKKGIEAQTFEGYLFPETYHFPKDVSPDKIIATMVRRFHEVYLPEWKQRAEELNMTVHQIVTLASIIEKETGAAFERPLISSVFHNRLKRGMRLASDPTVIYGIKDFNGNLTRRDLKKKTPYNTYRIRGLPPGPIANPGKASIKAALYPAKTDYLYFVSKKDSTHQFSTNLKDHNRAVRKYQLRK